MRKGKSAAKVLSCLMAAGMVLQTVGGLGGSGTVHAEETQPGSELLYFVDAGTMNPEKLGAGDQLGKYNSVTEQFYGEDPVTGKMWGLMDTPVEEEDYPDLMTGRVYMAMRKQGVYAEH